MYYDQTEQSNTTDGLSLGPIYITREQVCEDFLFFLRSFDNYFQIGIGIIVEMISFVPSILLVQLFRRIRQRRSHQYQGSPLRQALEKMTQQQLVP